MINLRRTLPAVIASLLLAETFSGEEVVKDPLTIEKLTDLLRLVEPWHDESIRYSESSWSRLVLAAKALQATSPKQVEEALGTFQNEHLHSEGPI